MRTKYLTLALILAPIMLVFSFLITPSGLVYAGNGDETEREVVDIDTSGGGDPAAVGCSGDDCGLIEKYGIPFLNFLGAIVGLVVTISIVVGGIQYASSADDPQKVAAAKKRIADAVIALVAFLFMYGFLQWLMPGGFI